MGRGLEQTSVGARPILACARYDPNIGKQFENESKIIRNQSENSLNSCTEKWLCSPTSLGLRGSYFPVLIAGSGVPASIPESSRNRVPGFPRGFSEGQTVKISFIQGSLKVL